MVTITLLDRARLYLEKIPGAVSGQGGHPQTFAAACALVHGFALSEAAANVGVSGLVGAQHLQMCPTALQIPTSPWTPVGFSSRGEQQLGAWGPFGWQLRRPLPCPQHLSSGPSTHGESRTPDMVRKFAQSQQASDVRQRCSGWAGLHRRSSTACGLTNRVVNADVGYQFRAPSSQYSSQMPLHLQRPGGAETVAIQQASSNGARPVSGVLESASAIAKLQRDAVGGAHHRLAPGSLPYFSGVGPLGPGPRATMRAGRRWDTSAGRGEEAAHR